MFFKEVDSEVLHGKLGCYLQNTRAAPFGFLIGGLYSESVEAQALRQGDYCLVYGGCELFENTGAIMTIITFDTHEFIKELKNAGFSEQQAEAITNLQKTVIGTTLEQAKHDHQLDDLATKRDLKELELKVAKDIAESKAELIRWVVGVRVLQMTLIVGLMLN